ncbi:hypothetical protein G6O69_34025 [Pseudenhygromyxa sp. WMMC2535]|uniref:hypothetical protein n=1 Tax=Pseudenhygromyxa sp. WMMC2535 TaxID=2712867 RepID=UPI00155636B6|nr:hypothetical protein [Pseudenhygromyxa sp. WMMC2535]NVB42889.1 hypothetical protein [Pseudenhygromyxa sp. WMMC2535]
MRALRFASPLALGLALLACSPEDTPGDEEAETDTDTGAAQTCLDTDTPGEDIILASDADIEEAALSGCVAEHVIVSGGGITSLAGLSELRQVGILDIRYNPFLDSLAGLEQLERVDQLILTGNNLLIELPEFPDLALGRATINANDGLTDLGSFPATTSMSRLEIDSNPALTDLSGLESLTGVSGNVAITNNAMIVDFTGFEAFTAIGGDLEIIDNAELDTLEGWGLVSVGGDVRVSSNPKLSECLAQAFIAMLEVGGAKIESSNESGLCD